MWLHVRHRAPVPHGGPCSASPSTSNPHLADRCSCRTWMVDAAAMPATGGCGAAIALAAKLGAAILMLADTCEHRNWLQLGLGDDHAWDQASGDNKPRCALSGCVRGPHRHTLLALAVQSRRNCLSAALANELPLDPCCEMELRIAAAPLTAPLRPPVAEASAMAPRRLPRAREAARCMLPRSMMTVSDSVGSSLTNEPLSLTVRV